LERQYEIVDLAKITAAPKRAVQFLADQMVIHSIPASGKGKGVPRVYTYDEAAILCIIQPLHTARLSIGVIRGIAESIRINLADPESHCGKQLREVMDRKATGYLIARRALTDDGSWALTIRSLNYADAVKGEEWSLLMLRCGSDMMTAISEQPTQKKMAIALDLRDCLNGL
jgi:hypothetical protein